MLLAFDVDGAIAPFNGPVTPYTLNLLKQRYIVGLLSPRSDVHSLASKLELHFSYKWHSGVFNQIKRDFPEAQNYVYVTGNPERSAVAEENGFITVHPEAYSTYGDNMTVLMVKVMLAALMNVANYLDYYTTKKAIEKGFKEGNPLARGIMRLGWRKYQLAKWLIPVFYGAYALTSEDPYYINMAGMAIATATFIYAAINNLMIIGGIKRGTETPQEQAE